MIVAVTPATLDAPIQRRSGLVLRIGRPRSSGKYGAIAHPTHAITKPRVNDITTASNSNRNSTPKKPRNRNRPGSAPAKPSQSIDLRSEKTVLFLIDV